MRPPPSPGILPPLAALLLALPGGCGSPFAGGWSGTMDVGPVLAHSVTLRMPPEGLEGDLVVQRPGEEDKRFRICKGSLKGDAFELTIDLARPDCVAVRGARRDRHVFRGTLGESLIFGEVFREGRRIGFFRAFRDKAEGDGLKVEGT